MNNELSTRQMISIIDYLSLSIRQIQHYTIFIYV